MVQYLAGQIVTDAELNTGSAQVDSTTFTINTLGSQQASNFWDIPAGAMAAGSAWRLTVIGKVTTSSSQNGLLISAATGPSGATLTTIVNFAASTLTVSSSFFYIYNSILVCNTAGAGGTYSVAGDFLISLQPGESQTFNWCGGAVGNSINTGVDSKFGLSIGWQAVTGTPVFTSSGSIFERLA